MGDLEFIPREAKRPASMAAMKARQSSKIAELRSILERLGYVTLDKQAKALGLSRSTTWVILRASHKASGLSGSIITRMLQSAGLSPVVRQWIEEYVSEKLSGAYGHSSRRLKLYQARVELSGDVSNHARNYVA